MGFGTGTSGVTSRTTANAAQVAEKMTEVGIIEDMTTYGATTETTVEQYVDAGSFANEAVNEQNGTSVVTSHDLIESNTDYARETKTIRAAQATT